MDISSLLDEARDWNNLYEIFVFKLAYKLNVHWINRIRMEKIINETF